jgi:adenylosuccinate lyase
MIELNSLTAISPIDGRYRNKVNALAKYFSEYGWMQYRVKVEIEYFIALCQIPLPQLQGFNHEWFDTLRKIYQNFTERDAWQIKEIEKTTNHDIKAVEYFIKQKLDLLGTGVYKEFIHFGLTSQDINNTAVPLLLKDAIEIAYKPLLDKVVHQLNTFAQTWATIPMLARTHGQPASPTKLGKEFKVFVERLENQKKLLETIPYSAKFGGATGNFNAHHVAYPQIDWVMYANRFVENMGLQRQQTTTQIEHYDYMGALMDNLKRINTILMDFDRDIWQYISMNYFKQKVKAGEVGSSAMPHKVNPIDFENSEGNLGIANALFEHLSQKLPISRLQRDLTDSTVLRNLGVPVAHTLIALESLSKGLEKLELNEAEIQKDLDKNWAVVAEAIQTILRRESYPNPYEALKDLTRGNQEINESVIKNFIQTLNISENIKAELQAITPFNYTGVDL